MTPATAAMIAALADPTADSTLLIKLDTATPEYLAIWPSDLTWDGETWVGDSQVKSVGKVEIRSKLDRELRIVLGVAGDLARLTAVANDIRGRDIEIWFAMLTSAGAVVADPLLEFFGVMSPGVMAAGKVEVICRSRFASRTGRAAPTYSEAWQRQVDNTDRCCFDISAKTLAVLERDRFDDKQGIPRG